MDSKSLQEMIKKLKETGWVHHDLGSFRSSGQTKNLKGYEVFIREAKIDDFLKKSSNGCLKNPVNMRVCGTGSNLPMGKHKRDMTLTPNSENLTSLATLSSFDNYPSLRAIRPDKPCILIAYDSEWQNLSKNKREMLSWQFATITDDVLIEICILKSSTKRLKFECGIACVLDYLGVSAIDKRVYDKMSNDEIDPIHVCLVCHAGLCDISGFEKTEFLLRHLTSVQGGVVTLQPIRMDIRSLQNVNNASVYPISLNIGDTMCHAPADMKKLEDLGHVVGIEKIDISEEQKDHMRSFLSNNPVGFMEYASRDAVVTLLYSSALYGYNNTPPVTITSATAKVMKESMMEYLGCTTNAEFDRMYRGLERVCHGKVERDDGRPGYIENTSLEPINDKTNFVQQYCSKAYHGGYNSCSEVGYFPYDTYDYDLQNAYPTAMCLIPDIDWSNPVKLQIQNQQMNLGMWNTGLGAFNPLVPFVGYVRFKFPSTVKYPCIPISVDGVPVYPLTSDGLEAVYTAGPFVYLALRLGAEIWCDNGYFLNTMLRDGAYESRSLSIAVKQLVKDRNLAKIECGKKSLEELTLKTMVNSGYGKNAQNVIQKNTWSAFKNSMEKLNCSGITNPFSAMMITSVVQCELIAAQNQIEDLGYMSCSVTTDGFISNIPESELKTLDLYGFRPVMEQSRLYLTDGFNNELWEIKHHQTDLINFTTRGNVSLQEKGVCAHNGLKSWCTPDSYGDRLWLTIHVLKRTKKVKFLYKEFVNLQDMMNKGFDFAVRRVYRNISCDFDLKRKPDRNTFSTDHPFIIEGETYEIAHFSTVPYENIDEFLLYRRKKSAVDAQNKCLRTEADWERFFLKIDTDDCGAKVRDLDWSILYSCIMGYRAGMWDIPALNDLSLKDKLIWINDHNNSGKEFKESDWKNARKPERQAKMLPKDIVEDKLTELQKSA